MTTAAVVVTFNRKVLLQECLAALLKQTHPVDHIFLIDNASTDGTPELLKTNGYLDHPCITYRRLDTNSGGAGGFYEGMKQAHEAGYDWIWVMDDDAEPLPNALELIARHYDKGYPAIGGLVTFTTGRLAVHHRGNFRKSYLSGSIAQPVRDAKKGDPLREIDFGSFVGLCISAKAISKIGLPRKEFFIHMDDTEYSMRLSTLGRLLLDPASVMIHKETAKQVPISNKYMRWLGSPHADIERLWIEYFGWRNRMWLIMKKHPVRGRLYAISAIFYLNLGIVLFDDHKAKRMKFWWNCFVDSFTGNFDNAKPRKILQG